LACRSFRISVTPGGYAGAAGGTPALPGKVAVGTGVVTFVAGAFVAGERDATGPGDAASTLSKTSVLIVTRRRTVLLTPNFNFQSWCKMFIIPIINLAPLAQLSSSPLIFLCHRRT
jgi:hypothetical protein